MKKILIAFAFFAFASCNNSSTHTEQTVDSSYNVTVDSLKNNIEKLNKSADSVVGGNTDPSKATIDSVKTKL